MSTCCRNNSWAEAILDGLPVTVSPAARTCQDNSWARTILDALPDGCQHITHATTQLSLSGVIGTQLEILKADVSAIDCGYIEPGSLIFSAANPGAAAVVNSVTCTHYLATVISLASASYSGLTPEQQQAINDLVLATTPDSLGGLKDKYNELISTLKAVFAGGT